MTEQRPYKHVYILGAGFSYAMGGPLFTELLTPTMATRCANVDQSGSATLNQPLRVMFDECARRFQSLSNVTDNPMHRGIYPGINVEQFLERCDAASWGKQPVFARNVLDGLHDCVRSIRSTPGDENEKYAAHMVDFVRMLKMRLAIETSAFLTEHIDESERWNPYVDWFTRLTKDDVIITTNYDRLIEEIAIRCGVEYPVDQELLPVNLYLQTMKLEANKPVLCKLHGSVDWILSGGHAYVQPTGASFPDWDKEVLLGVPGSSKIDLEKGVLKKVWDYAFEAIRNADFISIVGYSMPETDNRLRNRLLDAIVANRENLCEINIVLGGRSARGERAEMILKQAVRCREESMSRLGFPVQVNLLPIYAQDFLPRFVPRTEEEYGRERFVEYGC